MIDKIIELAKSAGEVILEVYGTGDFGVQYKEDSSPLTIADKRSNDLIAKGLKEIAKIASFIY